MGELSNEEEVMKERRPSLFRRAFASGHVRTLWLPLLVGGGSLFAGAMMRGWTFRHVASGCGVIYLLGLGYFLILAIVRFVAGRKGAGLGALFCLVISVAMMAPALVAALITGSMGDGFADDLKIPESMELVEPGREAARGEPGKSVDLFQAAMRASLEGQGGDDVSLRAEVPALATLWGERRELLMRYLASHPGWRVYEDKGGKFATRRWMVDDLARVLQPISAHAAAARGAEFSDADDPGIFGEIVGERGATIADGGGGCRRTDRRQRDVAELCDL
jgi:hypothetical protein